MPKPSSPKADSPKAKSWFTLKNEGESVPVKVWIHGGIGSYEIEAIDLIQALQEVGSRDVEFRIQSPGGSVYEGLAIYNSIKAHKGKTVGVIDGLAASIASYILMACDTIQMPENASLMIHNPSIGAWGGEDEIQSALIQLKNAKQTTAEAYSERSGKSLDEVLEAMDKETWFTAQQALEFGLVDEVIDAVNLSNCLKDIESDSLKAFKHPPKELLNQLEPVENEPAPEQENQPDEIPLAASAASSKPVPTANAKDEPTSQVSNMPKPNDNVELQAAVKKENARQAAIRGLCAQHKIKDELLNEMLDDMSCSEEVAASKILTALGEYSKAGTRNAPDNLTNTALYAGNGNLQKDSLQNALNARCGVGEIEKGNPYRLKSLMDMAEIAVGKDASLCSTKSELVARAFNTGDFADIITESVRTVMRDEAKVRAPLWRELANTENLPNFKETDLVMVDDAPDLMAVSEDGEYKQAIIKGSGEKIQLATFGREVAITRQAIINDEISLLSKLPRKFMQSGYRLSDKLMFNAILAGKMGDGKSVFQAGGANKWGNLTTGIAKGDYEALIMALHKSFATATTSEGDALDLRGEFLLASPDHASMLEAVVNTASKPDEWNAAYKKFNKVIETARMNTVNGAIGLTSKDFDSVIMGFLDGQMDPWLETGDGFTSDGAKFRITYDITSKVIDRRGIAQATFA